MADTFYVSIGVQQAAQIIDDAVVRGSVTGELIDAYGQGAPGGGGFVIRIYEKHFWRAGNRLTLTVVLDDFTGRTRVHCVGGGGGQGLINFDWGAAQSFTNVAANALAPYRL
ncbi:MAG: DUF6054 family protein [Bacillota bacterium]